MRELHRRLRGPSATAGDDRSRPVAATRAEPSAQRLSV